MTREWQDDMPNFVILRHSYHNTRKDRLCDCGRVIPAGARYERTVGTEDGDFFNSIRCAPMDPNNPCPHSFPDDTYEPHDEPRPAGWGEGGKGHE